MTGADVSDYKGGYNIKSVKDATGKALPFIINYTMMRVDLPAPLKTGEKFTFSVEWSYTEYNRQEFSQRGGYEVFHGRWKLCVHVRAVVSPHVRVR